MLSVLRRSIPLALVFVFAFAAAGLDAPSPAAEPVSAAIIPGDHPDPTMVRVGGSYYVTATTGKWAPVFPLFRSNDLRTWQQIGPIFQKPPAWTNGNYWAPELVRWSRRMLVFYSASRLGGKPCIGVASAARPEGPWRDRGRALCLPGGTIDVSPFTDRDGSRWLLYKAMGVGQGLWAVRFDERRLRAVGRPTLLIKPDLAWEQGTTEGPSLVLHGGQYHLFYAGGHCCRPPCTYREGVARSDHLLGPYVKDPANPIMRDDDAWKCKGHGTVVDLDERGTWLVHHGYRQSDTDDSRRSVLMTPVTFDAQNRAQLSAQVATDATAARSAQAGFRDALRGSSLQPGWEWPWDRPPALDTKHGGARLSCTGTRGWPSFAARQIEQDGFRAVAELTVPSRGTAAVGLSVVDPGWGIRGVEVRAGRVREMRAGGAGIQLGAAVPAPPGRRLALNLDVQTDGTLAASVSADGGPPVAVPPGPAAAGARPTRVALTCRGTGDAQFSAVSAFPTG